MLDLDLVIARVKALCPQFKLVGGSADLDAAVDSAPAALPAAFLMPMGEEATPLQDIGDVVELVKATFGVVMAVTNRRDATGQAAMGHLKPLRDELRQALVGWVPDPDCGEPVHMTGGRLLRFDQGRLWWVDQFAVNGYFWSNT